MCVFWHVLCWCICVGLCQKMAKLSGMRCLLRSLAVGVSIMSVTEKCVGEYFSAFCTYIYLYCAQFGFEKCATKYTFQQVLIVDKSVVLQATSPNGSETVSQDITS